METQNIIYQNNGSNHLLGERNYKIIHSHGEAGHLKKIILSTCSTPKIDSCCITINELCKNNQLIMFST